MAEQFDIAPRGELDGRLGSIISALEDMRRAIEEQTSQQRRIADYLEVIASTLENRP